MNKAALGAEGPSFELDVERGKIYEFARATMARSKQHWRRENPIIPPTFLTTAFHWELMVDGANPWAEVGMNLERGMHAEQEYVFSGVPPRAGAKLKCQSKIVELYEKAGRRGGKLEFCVMQTEFRDLKTGELVAVARMTGVETENVPEAEGEKSNRRPETGDRRPETAEGERKVRVIGPMTRTDIVRYQGASGDMNPIHHDEPFALRAGYGAPLVVGMFQAGVLANVAAEWMGPENLRKIRVRWKEQVWPGDMLTMAARIVSEDGGRVELELECTRAGGGVAVHGWATFVR